MTNKMLDYPQYLTEEHREVVHKPRYYSDGKTRRPTHDQLSKLVKKWRHIHERA